LPAVADSLAEAVAALASDPDARVRYQVAFTIGALPNAVRERVLPALLTRDGANPWARLAVLSSAGGQEAVLLNTLIADVKSSQGQFAGSLVPSLAAQAARQPAQFQQVVSALERLAADDARFAESALNEVATSAPSDQLLSTLRASEPLTRARESILTKARAAATGASSPAARVRAIRSLVLGTFKDSRDVLVAALDARQPHDVQLAATSTLGAMATDDADAALVALWPSFTPRLRTSAAEVMFARPARAARFLKAAEAGKFALSDLDPGRLKQLAEADDISVRELARTLLEKRHLGPREEVVAKYRPALELKGDPAKGRLTFRNTCAQCHRLESFGHEVGPNLAAMASRGAEAVLVNVLDPNREVTPQYVDYIVEITDGRTLTGMLAAETANSVTLKRAENATDTVLRSNIKRMRSGRVSIMPEGLEQQIDVQGMADLIAYVMSVK
jgi:putative heme-binding domain-containing protein